MVTWASRLWLTLTEGVRFYFCLCPLGWWKWPPSLPLPSMKYIEFRRHTAYGMKEHGWGRPKLRKQWEDIQRFLLWRRRLRRAQERTSGGH